MAIPGWMWENWQLKQGNHVPAAHKQQSGCSSGVPFPLSQWLPNNSDVAGVAQVWPRYHFSMHICNFQSHYRKKACTQLSLTPNTIALGRLLVLCCALAHWLPSMQTPKKGSFCHLCIYHWTSGKRVHRLEWVEWLKVLLFKKKNQVWHGHIYTHIKCLSDYIRVNTCIIG